MAKTKTTIVTNTRTPTIYESPFSIQGERITGSNFSTQVIGTDPGALSAFVGAIVLGEKALSVGGDAIFNAAALSQSGLLTQAALASQNSMDIFDAANNFATRSFDQSAVALDTVKNTKFRAETPESSRIILFALAAGAVIFILKRKGR